MKPFTEKYLLALLSLAVAVVLSFFYIFVIGGQDDSTNITQLTGSVISDLVAVLIGFSVVYLLIERFIGFDSTPEQKPIQPIINIGLQSSDLRDLYRRDTEIIDLKKRFENSNNLNSEILRNTKVKLESDIQFLEKKINELITEINANKTRDNKSEMALKLEELLADRSKKEREYENLRESSLLSLLFEKNNSELDELRKQNEHLTKTIELKKDELKDAHAKNNKFKTDNQNQSIELNKCITENRELKKIVETKSLELHNLKLEYEKLKVGSSDISKLRAENEGLKVSIANIINSSKPLFDEINKPKIS